jgi:transposase-like protein
MKKRKIYSGKFKAKLVREWIEGKRNLFEIADEHQVHPNQIKNWKSTLLKRAHLVLSDQRKKNRIRQRSKASVKTGSSS